MKFDKLIGCIIQARMGSSRLPKKVMMEVEPNMPIIKSLIKQLDSSKTFEKIIIATTTLSEDDVIYDYVNSQNIDCFRGSSDDVLDRYYNCAKAFSLDVVIRITCDNPLIDPNIVDLVVESFYEKKCDFATNTMPRTYPFGTEVEVFSFKILEDAWMNAKKPSDREHVTSYMMDSGNNSIYNLTNSENLSHLRYTVDKLEDLRLVQEIVKMISVRPILLQNIVDVYKKNPRIFDINKNVKHDGYLSSLKKDEQYLKSKK